jgi:PAS domain S-box-containing protein
MVAGDEISRNQNPQSNDAGSDPDPDLDFGLSLDECRSLFSVGRGVHYVCEAHGNFAALFIAPSISAQFGYEPKDFTANSEFWASNIHPEDRPRVFRDLNVLFEQGFHQHEYRFRHKDGEYRWVSDDLKLLRDPSGVPSKIVGQWIDVSAKKREQEAAAFSERRFQTLADGAIEGILVHRDLKPLFINQALADMYGYTVDEFMSMETLLQIFKPNDRKRFLGYSEARSRGENAPSDYEQQGVRKDGSIIWLRNMARQIDWDGQAAIQSVVVDITAQKLLEVEMRENEARRSENEARLRTILDNAPIAIYLKDIEGRFVFSNKQNAQWYGVDPVAAIGRGTKDYFPSDYAAIAVRRDRMAMDNRKTVIHEGDVPMRGGGTQHCLIHRVPLIDKDGELHGVLGMNQDITELKQMERLLHDAINAMSEGFALYDAEERLVICNQPYRDTLPKLDALGVLTPGRTTEEILRAGIKAGFIPPVYGSAEEYLTNRLERFRQPDGPYEYVTSNDHWVRIEERKTSNGETVAIRTDITGRKRAEIALRETENRVRDFAEATSDWFWQTDTEQRVTHRSSTAGGAHDVAFAGRQGTSRFDFEEFDGEPRKWQLHREDLAARRPFRDFRYKRPMPGGGVLHSSISGRPYFDLDGTFLGYRGTGMDVTAEVEARSQLVDAIDSMADGVVIFDAEGRLVTFNERYRETYKDIENILTPGTRFEDLARAGIEQELFADAVGREEDWLRERLENFHQGQNLVEQQMADGSWIQITERKTPNGYTVGIRTDITELKQREERFRQSQKLEAVGQLTGGVAHDFNNMLAAIIGNLDLIQDGDMDDAFSKQGIAIALQAAHRGAELTHRLLAYSRQQELNAKIIDINEMLPKFCQLAQRTIGEDIAMEMKLAAGLWPTMVDAGQLENALLNLAINARDAMPAGGQLTIETANIDLLKDGTAIYDGLIPGSYVVIAVSDNGTGMPADVRTRVFEPFFTTKDVGEGSGLGLSMVFGFAKQSGGQVSIYSEEGEGTTVRILLPRADVATNAEHIAEGTVQDRPTGSETILVVEDDRDVRKYLVIVLRGLGYTVLEAEDGPTALEVMTASGPIDLLLTDVILPRGMSGRDVAAAFAERYPAAGVLYSSGYTREVLNRRGGLEADVALLNKPYQTPALAQRVREILDGRK